MITFAYMQKAVKIITIQAALYLVVLSFTAIQITNGMYFHSHKLADGTLISHAHPFNKAKDRVPVNKHHHTSGELFLLDHIQVLINSTFPLPLVLTSSDDFRVSVVVVKKISRCSPEFPFTRPPPIA